MLLPVSTKRKEKKTSGCRDLYLIVVFLPQERVPCLVESNYKRLSRMVPTGLERSEFPDLFPSPAPNISFIVTFVPTFYGQSKEILIKVREI